MSVREWRQTFGFRHVHGHSHIQGSLTYTQHIRTRTYKKKLNLADRAGLDPIGTCLINVDKNNHRRGAFVLFFWKNILNTINNKPKIMENNFSQLILIRSSCVVIVYRRAQKFGHQKLAASSCSSKRERILESKIFVRICLIRGKSLSKGFSIRHSNCYFVLSV